MSILFDNIKDSSLQINNRKFC